MGEKKIPIFILAAILAECFSANIPKLDKIDKRFVIERKPVTDDTLFSYVVSILYKTNFLCAGALINDEWVITAADAMYSSKELKRFMRVHVGSVNYKSGGELVALREIEVHPNFDDSVPEYDVALVRLAKKVRLTPTVDPVRIMSTARESDITFQHFLVTSWVAERSNIVVAAKRANTTLEDASTKQISAGVPRHRFLQLTMSHPIPAANCSKYLRSLEMNVTDGTICLDSQWECTRDGGAPVVHNRMLWGVVSSWKPDECNLSRVTPTLVTMISKPAVYNWIRSTMVGETWSPEERKTTTVDSEFDYDENEV